MTKSKFRKGTSFLLAMVMCLSTFLGIGTTTAFAAGEQADVYMISFPRDGDANYGGEWGHPNLSYMNGWSSGKSSYTTIRAMNSYEGNICYCIEPGVSQNTGDSFTAWDENFWDNYPSDYNQTISGNEIKQWIGRILEYGYTGQISLNWRSQNDGGDSLAYAVATQLLIWETVVGERDSSFGKVGTGGCNAVLESVSTEHPLYSQIMSYYRSIADSVQKHTALPSFCAESAGGAESIELEWDGTQYTAVLKDTNGVLGNYSFTADTTGFSFSVSGNKLTITVAEAPEGSVTITAAKNHSQRRGVITWTDGSKGPSGGTQDVVTYAQSINDPVSGYVKLKVSYGSAKIVKSSEDGNVSGISFTITGEGVNQTVQTDKNGEFQMDNLKPGIYTVTEQSYDKYEPQESRRVTVASGQTATVTFSNVLKRGDLAVYKNSEDGLNEGITFHLYGTSLSGQAVDEYAITDSDGIAYFGGVLIGSGYTLEEMDTPNRYVVPDSQTTAIEWNTVTNKSFSNVLKKWNATVTKSDGETGTAQGDASLAGAVYGVYKGDQLIDTYSTDANGQFTTDYYVCGNDWTIREISPSEGYLLDDTVYEVGASANLYTVEHNFVACDVTEQVLKGQIALIKHTDNGDTQLETPEEGAEFAVYRHLHQAQKGIRFIDPNYKELFRIPDGEKIRINLKIGEHRDRFCRYIDETHMELSGGYDSTLYHICEFAERVRDTGSTVVPLRSSLPEQCYSNLLDTGAVVILKRGKTGYYKTDIPFKDRVSAVALVEEYNSKLGVSKAQLEAMKAGSMFGFHVPAADPKNYDENGQPIRPTARGRGDAR